MSMSISESLLDKDDLYDFYKEILKVRPTYLQYADETMRNKYELLKIALLSPNVENEHILMYAGAELRDNINLVVLAVSLDADNLQYASDRLRGNVDVVMWAMRNSPDVIAMASSGLLSDIEFAKRVIHVSPETVLRNMHADIRKNEDFILGYFNDYPEIIYHIDVTLKYSNEFMIKVADSIKPVLTDKPRSLILLDALKTGSLSCETLLFKIFDAMQVEYCGFMKLLLDIAQEETILRHPYGNHELQKLSRNKDFVHKLHARYLKK